MRLFKGIVALFSVSGQFPDEQSPHRLISAPFIDRIFRSPLVNPIRIKVDKTSSQRAILSS